MLVCYEVYTYSYTTFLKTDSLITVHCAARGVKGMARDNVCYTCGGKRSFFEGGRFKMRESARGNTRVSESICCCGTRGREEVELKTYEDEAGSVL